MAEEGHGEHEEGGHSKGHGGGGHGGGHGGGGHEEHEGVPEWMVSFADNTALMMGLFVILLAMNMGPKAKSVMGGEPSDKASEAAASANNEMLDFVIGLRESFHNPVDMGSNNPRDAGLRKRMMERAGEENNAVSPSDNNKKGGAVRPSDYNDVGASVSFDDGSALMTALARNTIVDVAKKLADSRYVVEVRGHASPFETFMNVEKGLALSYERALTVSREMATQGVKWSQIRVVACGDNERVVGRTFDRAKDAANQRVEVILTKELVAADPNSKEAVKGK